METTLLKEIRKRPRIPPSSLKRASQKDARLFHSSHRPNNKELFTIIYGRQRSTLSRLNFGPKDGQYLTGWSKKKEGFA